MKPMISFIMLSCIVTTSLQAQDYCTLIKAASVSNCAKDFRKTEIALKEIIKHFPNENLIPEIRLSLGQILFKTGKYDASSKILSNLLLKTMVAETETIW